MAKKFGGDLIHNLVSQGADQGIVSQPNNDTTNSSTTSSLTTNSNNKAQQDNKMRTSYIISKDVNLKLKYIALKEGRTISDMVEEAFEKMIATWEKKNGPTPDL